MNALTKTETNLPSSSVDSWGQNEMSQKDIIIPKIQLMQPTSDQVNDGKAKFGEFLSSLDGSILGEAFEFTPFYMTKMHWVSKLKDAKSGEFKFDRTEPILTAADEEKPWEDTDSDGTPIKRTLVRQFFGMVKGQPLPMVIQAKGMSGAFAKKLITQMYVINRTSKLPPCGVVVKIKSIKQKNAKGNFAIMDFSIERKTTQEEVATCFEWYQSLSKQPIKTEAEEQTNMNF